MRRIVPRLVVSSLTFLIGVGATYFLPARLRHPLSPDALPAGPPCRDGWVSAEPQPGAPLRLSILGAACQGSRTPLVRFEVENVSARPISYYSVFLYEIPEDATRGRYGSGLGPEVGYFQPLQKRAESLGGDGLGYGPGGTPVRVKEYALAVCSVSYTDGTWWHGGPPCS